MAQYTKWRKRQFAYDPMRGLRYNDIKHMRSSASHEQPHRAWLYQWKTNSREAVAVGATPAELVFTGCTCYACQKYYAEIARLNMARFKVMTGLDYQPKTEDSPIGHECSVEDRELLTESDWLRLESLMAKFGAITLAPVFRRKALTGKKLQFSIEKHIRDTRGKSTPKWRG